MHMTLLNTFINLQFSVIFYSSHWIVQYSISLKQLNRSFFILFQHFTLLVLIRMYFFYLGSKGLRNMLLWMVVINSQQLVVVFERHDEVMQTLIQQCSTTRANQLPLQSFYPPFQKKITNKKIILNDLSNPNIQKGDDSLKFLYQTLKIFVSVMIQTKYQPNIVHTHPVRGIIILKKHHPQNCNFLTMRFCIIIKMLTAQQLHKHTQNFFTQVYPTDTYQPLKQLLYNWRDNSKSTPLTITTFLKILQLVAQKSPELLDDLNRCLLKDFTPQSQPASLLKIRQLALDNPNAVTILDTVVNWMQTEQPVTNGHTIKAPQLEELSQNQFLGRLERHERHREISKIIYLYRRCILTVGQFKKLLQPIYLSDPSFFNMLFQYSEELEAKRRRVTIFAPLNELVDQKYPLEQVGNSYIIIPQGYANWGHTWAQNPLQNTLNRICVSVPLGTEGSFIITRKNEFEQQLLKNQQEKYEIDSNLASLQAALKLIEKTKRLNHPLVQRLLLSIYPAEVVGIMMRSSPAQVAKTIVVPRLKQKLTQLTRCRQKFQKVCEEVASKNFYKSLDYRCFYFCKNDKKFNCPLRWEKEIQLRKKQVIIQQITHNSELQIEDRESLQHSRNYTVNSFDNITTQQLLPLKKMEFGQRKFNAPYPPFPNNQVLFLIDFSDNGLLNEVLEILLFHTQKKNLLELMVFKLLRLSIQRKLQKEANVLQFIEGRGGDIETGSEPLNQAKTNKRVYKDLTDQFLELIEEDIEPAQIEPLQFPFQGPEEHTFIGTKQCYFFVRYLLTIYHRFSRARTLSEERGTKGDEPSLYSQFLSVLIHKIKQQKGLQEYLRKIFQQDAFIFFTLDKLMLGLVKLINNINTDSLTHKILKDGVKDYDLEIRKWQDYPHASVTQQLARLYRENEMLFRFTYSQKLLFISAWENGQPLDADKKKKQGEYSGDKNIQLFMNDPVYYNRQTKNNCYQQNQNQYFQDQNGNIVMWGEESLCSKRRAQHSLVHIEIEINRLRKLRIL